MSGNDLIRRGSVKILVSDTWWDEIDSIPAVDAVEVVKCGQCSHIQPFRPHDGFCQIDGMLRDNDFFCKFGHRREDGDA